MGTNVFVWFNKNILKISQSSYEQYLTMNNTIGEELSPHNRTDTDL